MLFYVDGQHFGGSEGVSQGTSIDESSCYWHSINANDRD